MVWNGQLQELGIFLIILLQQLWVFLILEMLVFFCSYLKWRTWVLGYGLVNMVEKSMCNMRIVHAFPKLVVWAIIWLHIINLHAKWCAFGTLCLQLVLQNAAKRKLWDKKKTSNFFSFLKDPSRPPPSQTNFASMISVSIWNENSLAGWMDNQVTKQQSKLGRLERDAKKVTWFHLQKLDRWQCGCRD